MEDKKNLSQAFVDSQKKNEEYFALCHQIIDEDNLDEFMKSIVKLLNNFNNPTLASFVAAYMMQAVSQAVKQTAEEKLKSDS